MILDCPHCSQSLEIDDHLTGETLTCPTCSQAFTVSAPEAVGTAAAAAEAPPASPAASVTEEDATIQAPPAAPAAPVPHHPAPIRRRVQNVPARTAAAPRRPVRRSRAGRYLLIVLLAGLGGLGYAMYRSPELFEQLRHRVAALVGANSAPTPAPPPSLSRATPPPDTTEETEPPPAEASMPTPEPTTAAATPEPVPVPQSTPDLIAFVIAHREAWPAEVELRVPERFEVTVNGVRSGSVDAPPGATLKVERLEPGFVTATYVTASRRLPINSTDLAARAPMAVKAYFNRLDIARRTALATPRAAAPSSSPPAPLNDGGSTAPFVHPGLLHNDEDFARMRTHLGQTPWKEGWERLTANRHASLDYKPNPHETVVRGRDRLATAPENYASLFNDIAAAYACALRWRVTDDVRYAEKSVEIMNAWSAKLKTITGSSDRCLAAGFYGYEFANAAEIMRTYKGWKPEDFARFQKMMLEVFYPMNKDFLTHHNGTKIDHYWANWDLCNVASMLAIGVLCDRRPLYNEAVNYFKTGPGNGSIRRVVYYIHPDGLGQWQESGRDQGHTVLGIALVGAICEMAWKQGDDLYGLDNNRLLAGCEYVAKYNLGEDVPYKPYTNSDVTQEVIGDKGRGEIRPAWELIYNHYVKRKGLPAPYSTRMAEQIRPEGGGGDYGPNSGGFDQLGYGTLTATLATTAKHDMNAAPPAETKGR